jgi:hypothetical protein
MIFENRDGEAGPTQATVRAFKPLEQTKKLRLPFADDLELA